MIVHFRSSFPLRGLTCAIHYCISLFEVFEVAGSIVILDWLFVDLGELAAQCGQVFHGDTNRDSWVAAERQTGVLGDPARGNHFCQNWLSRLHPKNRTHTRRRRLVTIYFR